MFRARRILVVDVAEEDDAVEFVMVVILFFGPFEHPLSPVPRRLMYEAPSP